MSRKKCQNNKKSFGDRLRLFRRSTRLNIVDFSILLGISHSSLSQVENNKTITSAQTISNLVQNTNINIYWLFTGEGEMIRNPEKEVSVAENSTYIYKEEDTETAGLISMTREVLKSNTDYSVSLAANVRSFHHAIKTESRLNGMDKTIKHLVTEIKDIKQSSKQTGKIRESDSEVEKGAILKKRVM
ncbi:MAG: helix-turn-helix transcriptional regulator [Deltaproteobacteria bacterium]|nr:helix-turn-helix transcriptional regulator [Deltaproteobacteria bacterium]